MRKAFASFLIFISLFAFSGIPKAYAVSTATADFNALTTATLNGQAGGTGWSGNWGSVGSFNPGNTFVESTTVYEGAKAVVDSGGVSAPYRILSPTIGTSDSSVIYIALRRTSTSGTDDLQASWRNSADSGRWWVALAVTGHMTLGAGAGLVDLGTYSANTWYVFRLTYNMSTGKVTAAVSTGAFGTAGTFGAESAQFTMLGTGAIDHISLNGGDANTGFYDYISPTSPFTAAAATTNAYFNSFWW